MSANRWNPFLPVAATGIVTAVLLCAVPVSAQNMAADSPTTPQLVVWVYALDYRNNLIPDVGMRYEVAGTRSGTVQTARDGVARIFGTALGQIVRVEVKDTVWFSTDGVLEGEIGGQPLAFRVFPLDPDSMTEEERLAAHRARVRSIVEQRRRASEQGEAVAELSNSIDPDSAEASGEAGARTQPEPFLKDPAWGLEANRQRVAFVEGLRIENPQGITVTEDRPSTFTGEAEIKVINGLGHPIRDVMVELWELSAGEQQQITLADVTRTGESGVATFSRLDPDAWYRIECRVEGEGEGRSTVFRVGENDMRRLAPLVVRPEDRSLSGFVLRSNGPARFARVRLLDSSGQTSLSTSTDGEGYFVLGPIPSNLDSIRLRVTHHDPTDVDLTLPVPADRELSELLIPLDALERDLIPSEAATP
jgi:hypothetical protein